jgi:predicted GH43/DUF377 family glycosyl hydrolase
MPDLTNRTWQAALMAIVAAGMLAGCGARPDASVTESRHGMEYPWMIGPFAKRVDVNPCLVPDGTKTFVDPITQQTVPWQRLHAYNPAAIVKDGRVYLLFRAEDGVGTHDAHHHWHSRIGLAISSDGHTFVSRPAPVLYPDHDAFTALEWEGGCEDPRVVATEDGRYVIYYTAYDGKKARLSCAESTDLEHWTKHGPIFRGALLGKYADVWSKSGSVVCRREGDHIYAVRLNGKYWMYWGEGDIFAATSDDLIHWTPVEYHGVLLPVITPRRGAYDSHLCEPGPPALLTKDGIVLIYNGSGDTPAHDGHVYAGGQLLLDPANPTAVIMRTTRPFIWPTETYDIWQSSANRKSGNCFLENLVVFQGKYIMYYGAADHEVAIAETAPSG